MENSLYILNKFYKKLDELEVNDLVNYNFFLSSKKNLENIIVFGDKKISDEFLKNLLEIKNKEKNLEIQKSYDKVIKIYKEIMND